jgi:hypothetical protein
LSSEVFWELGPPQLDALYRRHRQARHHGEILAGIVASAVVNFSFAHPKKPVTYADFGLGPRKAIAATRGDINSPDQVERLRRSMRARAGIAPRVEVKSADEVAGHRAG